MRYEVIDSILGVIATFAMYGDACEWCDAYNIKVNKHVAAHVKDTLEKKEPTND